MATSTFTQLLSFDNFEMAYSSFKREFCFKLIKMYTYILIVFFPCAFVLKTHFCKREVNSDSPNNFVLKEYSSVLKIPWVIKHLFPGNDKIQHKRQLPCLVVNFC